MYAVLHWGWTPKNFISLPQKDKAFVIASILEKISAEDELRRKLASR
jgi:hypothetical protein